MTVGRVARQRAPRWWAVLGGLAWLLGFHGVHGGPGLQFAVAEAQLTYHYDALGRLRAVVDPASDSATYTYDAVGNLLSITRQSSTTVSLIEVTPTQGPAGTVVALLGTGFSPTASQNTVTFNGVGATVTAATATQLTTTVPAGATTGVIVVTAPGGSSPSATPFTVAATAAPTITGVSPTLGLAGTAVTVTGTNFDLTAANNRLAVNQTFATVAAATATSLATSVPARAAGGRVAVTTPEGTATSAADLFVLTDAQYTLANVEHTARMAIGDTRTTTLSGATNSLAVWLFDGPANQRVSVSTTTAVTLFGPDATLLGSAAGFLDTLLLPYTATYTLQVHGPNAVSATLYHVPPDVTGAIALNDPYALYTITTPGQNLRVTFPGTAGQTVTAWTASSTSAMLCFTTTVFKPDGTTLATKSSACTAEANLALGALPATGTYTILVDPSLTGTGSFLHVRATSP